MNEALLTLTALSVLVTKAGLYETKASSGHSLCSLLIVIRGMDLNKVVVFADVYGICSEFFCIISF